MSTRGRGPLLVLLASLVLAVGVGAAFGAIPNPSDGRYYACRVKQTGAVRLINYPKVSTCPKGRRLISWNAQGPVGAQGLQGLQGLQGPPGPAGITKVTLTTVTSPATVVAPLGWAPVSVTCPAGKVVGGGFSVSTTSMRVTDSIPSGHDQWTAWGYNTGVSNANVYASAICMTTDPGAVIAKASEFKIARKRGK